MTVAEAQQRVTASEFAEWRAFYRLDPFGEERADYRMGILAAVTANLWLDKGDKPTRPEDFLPVFGGAAADLEDRETTTAPRKIDVELGTAPQKERGTTDKHFRAAMLALGR